jgi:5-methylcytosine-specific restriction protein A
MQTLKPRLQAANTTTVKPLADTPGSTPRQRGRAWMERREKLLRANPLCAMCLQRGMSTPAREVDHVTPLHQGGPDVDSNTQNLCVSCHKEKTALDGSRWRNGEA